MLRIQREVHIFVLLGDKFYAAIFYGFDGWASEFLGVYIPLVGEQGFDNHTAAIAIGYGHIVFFNAVQQAQGFKVGDYFTARGKAFHTAVLFWQG